MPSTSQAQHKFMAAVASGSIKKEGLPPEKAAEFVHADKGWKKLAKRKGK